MTAEAVVLNKSAVAMAADSAVTISAGRRNLKTYPSANKLFELVKGRPVGIMVYGNGQINGVPWETLIKTYRRECADAAHDTLAGYAAEFVQFLGETFLLSDESEQRAAAAIAYEITLRVSGHIKQSFHRCVTSTGRTVKTRLRAVADEAIERTAEWIESLPNDRRPLDIADLRAAYGESLSDMVKDGLGQEEITQAQRNRVTDLALLACTKDITLQSESGLVIAGFGERNAFPSVVETVVRGRLLGRIRSGQTASRYVSDDQRGFLKTYAQDEMATQYITGINPQTQREVIKWWRGALARCERTLAKRVAETHPRLAEATVKSICSEQRKVLREDFDAFLAHMQSHLLTEFLSPLYSSIALLPKDELALLAESLVNLTSLQQRVSIRQLETVGGEIDVALISRGDGFIWLKRKHYFSLELNPTWPWRHGAMDGVPPLPVSEEI